MAESPDMSDVHVHLPELPFWPNDVATEDRELLDQLGSDYVNRCGQDAPEVVRFLYGDLSVIAFDRLSVQGFPAQEYELLLNVSSSFLEDLQATVLATVQAVAEGDAAIGRRAAIANSAMGLWLASYGMGLMEGRKDPAAPRFV